MFEQKPNRIRNQYVNNRRSMSCNNLVERDDMYNDPCEEAFGMSRICASNQTLWRPPVEFYEQSDPRFAQMPTSCRQNEQWMTFAQKSRSHPADHEIGNFPTNNRSRRGNQWKSRDYNPNNNAAVMNSNASLSRRSQRCCDIPEHQIKRKTSENSFCVCFCLFMLFILITLCISFLVVFVFYPEDLRAIGLQTGTQKCLKETKYLKKIMGDIKQMLQNKQLRIYIRCNQTNADDVEVLTNYFKFCKSLNSQFKDIQ